MSDTCLNTAFSDSDQANNIFQETGANNWSMSFRFIKRMFDIVFSLVVLILGFIPGLILMLVATIDTKGSPLYTQERMGVGGEPFKMLKFRTMVVDADNVEKYFTEDQLEQWHRERKVSNDPRVTPVGSFLRKISIDEFPQFINVLTGKMSTIGPRAITKEELDWFGENRNLLLSVRPGITGVWQTGPRNRACFEDGSRQALELSYISQASISLDLKIIFSTLPAMIKGNGI